MTCLAPFGAPLSTTDDAPLWDWAVTAPGDTIPTACGITRKSHTALLLAMRELTHATPGTRADIWTAQLGLLDCHGYRRSRFPRYSMHLTDTHTIEYDH